MGERGPRGRSGALGVQRAAPHLLASGDDVRAAGRALGRDVAPPSSLRRFRAAGRRRRHERAVSRRAISFLNRPKTGQTIVGRFCDHSAHAESYRLFDRRPHRRIGMYRLTRERRHSPMSKHSVIAPRTITGAPYATRPGSRFPPGATAAADGVNFCVFSRHATRVELLLFADAESTEPFQTIALAT